MDKPKTKPAKKTPKQTGAKTHSVYPNPPKPAKNPSSIKGTAQTMRIGGPEHNANTGNEHIALDRQKRAKKDGYRRKRNAGR